MLKDDKYFELIKIAKSPEIMLAYKNRSFFSIYPTGLANIGFALLLTFSSAPIFSELSVLSDALLGRRSYNDAIMIAKI
jgi:hypothetical protein